MNTPKSITWALYFEWRVGQINSTPFGTEFCSVKYDAIIISWMRKANSSICKHTVSCTVYSKIEKIVHWQTKKNSWNWFIPVHI